MTTCAQISQVTHAGFGPKVINTASLSCIWHKVCRVPYTAITRGEVEVCGSATVLDLKHMFSTKWQNKCEAVKVKHA